MTDDSLLPFCFPAIGRKKVTAAFDGGRLSSDGGVMLLAQAERRLGLAERLAAVIPDGRDQSRVTHLLPDSRSRRRDPNLSQARRDQRSRISGRRGESAERRDRLLLAGR